MTITTLSAELQESIKKNLPHMVGEELQKVLADGVQAKADLEDTTRRLGDEIRKTKQQENDYNRLENECKGLRSLKLRKEDLDEQERNQKVVLLEANVTNESRLSKQAFDMVSLVFRNSEVRRSLNTSVPVTQTQPGGYSTTSTHYTHETTSEETK